MLTVLVLSIIAVGAFLGYVDAKMHLRTYEDRVCQGRYWRRMFPQACKADIRAFLMLFEDAFAIGVDKLKFHPNDRIEDIYHKLNPYAWGGDALEYETLDDRLKYDYGLELEDVWRGGLTLGELFIACIKHKSHTRDQLFSDGINQ